MPTKIIISELVSRTDKCPIQGKLYMLVKRARQRTRKRNETRSSSCNRGNPILSRLTDHFILVYKSYFLPESKTPVMVRGTSFLDPVNARKIPLIITHKCVILNPFQIRGIGVKLP